MRFPHCFMLAAALLGAGVPASAASGSGTAWIVATVGHSEWCPAGNVRIDLSTGRYALTPRASRRVCGRRDLERPVVTGRLGGARLAALRSAFRRALAEGLESAACHEHRPPEEIVISNGGPQILVVTSGAASASAPEELGCWSGAAIALDGALEDAFAAMHQP